MKKQTSIVSTFEMDETGNLRYECTLKGNISEVVKLGHSIFIECKKRFGEFRREEEEKEEAMYEKRNSLKPFGVQATEPNQ